MKKKIIYAYWIIYEYYYYRDFMRYGFIAHWRRAWRNYYVRPNWYKIAQTIHERQKREVEE